MSLLTSLVGLVLASGGFVVILYALQFADLLPPRYTTGRLNVGIAIQWVVTIAIVALVLVVEGKPLSALGVKPSLLDAGGVFSVFYLGLLAFIVVAVAGVGFQLLLKLVGFDTVDEGTLFALTQSTPQKLFLALTAGVTEELLFRGFFIERVVALTGSVTLAATLSVVVFALNHAPNNGLRGAVQRLGLGVGFVAAYVLTESVFAVAFAHVLFNAILLLSTDVSDALEETDSTELDDRLRRSIEEG